MPKYTDYWTIRSLERALLKVHFREELERCRELERARIPIRRILRSRDYDIRAMDGEFLYRVNSRDLGLKHETRIIGYLKNRYYDVYTQPALIKALYPDKRQADRRGVS